MKKLLALLLALVMIVGMVACGNANAPKETEAPKAETPKETEAKTDTPAQTEAPVVDEEPVVLTYGIRKLDTVEDYDNAYMTKLIEETCNVDLQFVYFSSDASEARTQVGLMVSNNERLPDLMQNHNSSNFNWCNEYGQMGYFLDISEYLTDPEKMPLRHESFSYAAEGAYEWILSMATDPTTGGIYTCSVYMEEPWNTIEHNMWVNQRWLDECGLEVPTTTEEYYEMLKAFKAKYPEKITSIGARAYRSDYYEWLLNAFIYNCANYYWNVTDNKLWSPYGTDEYREGLKYCRKLQEEGLIDDITLTLTKNSELKEVITPTGGTTGEVGVFSGHPELVCNPEHDGVLEYVPVTRIDSGNGSGGWAVIRSEAFQTGTIVTADCERVDKAIEVLDFLSSRYLTMVAEAGEEGVHWKTLEPGEMKNILGGDAAYHVWDTSLWSNQNSYLWNHDPCSIITMKGSARANEDDGSFTYKRYKMQADHYYEAVESPRPDQIVRELVYTAEENEIVSEYLANLKTWVRSQRHLFISGELDINDDAEWQRYLDELKANGEDECLKCAQSAWNRMNGVG